MLLGTVALLAPASLSAAQPDRTELMSALSADPLAVKAQTSTNQTFRLADAQTIDIKVDVNARISAPKAADGAPIARAAAVKKGVPTTADKLKGYMVGTYKTLSSSSFDGGGTMSIEPNATGDSISIAYFWNGATVKAHLDAATGTVTIPSQVVYDDPEQGPCALATTSSDGKPDYEKPLVGTVSADGTIDFGEEWWGVFITSGKYKDLFVAAYYDLKIQKPTGTMTYKTASGAQNGYYVVVKQTSGNVLTVTNIFNQGLDIEMELNRNRTASMNQQVASINANGSWVIIKCLAFNDAGNLTQYSGVLTTNEAPANDNTTITWTDWSLLSTQANAYAGRLTDAVLTSFSPIEYPTLTVTEFEGEGTEANPYLIKTLDDLLLLADKVNTDTEYVGTGSANTYTYTRSYKDKFFALGADIDMNGYRFEPIGSTYRQRFAGTFDGKGHTIKGLNVNAGTQYYAGLFGLCDTVSVLKNVVLDSPVVSSQSGYAGSLVSSTMGDVKGITVINPQVVNEVRIVSAGVAGIVGGEVSDCHVKGGVIAGAGYVAGVIAEAHGGIYNCSAEGTKVYGFGAYYPTGGVVANLYFCTGQNLSFSGLVSYDMGIENQYIGGVVGMVSAGELKNSFSVGVVRGYASTTICGGVVGRLNGKISDCYSAGFIQCYSRMTGGIVGQMNSYREVSDGPLLQSELHNCYTSATTQAETYQYDRNQFAEAIGSVSADSEPVIENVYFDRQVTNYGSKTLGATTAELTAAAGPKGFSADNWTFTEGAYPRVKALADTESAKYSASAVDFSASDSYNKLSQDTKITALGNTKFLFLVGNELTTKGHYAEIVDNNTIKIGSEFGIDTLYVVNGSTQTYHFLSVAPIPFEGSGTEFDPFLIKSKSDLIALSEATTVKHQLFEGMYFEMTNDIDLEHDPAFLGISADESNTAASISFQGVFDGKGHTVDNMDFTNLLVWSKEPTATAFGTLNASSCRAIKGLFGRLGETGVVKNINIGAGSKLIFYAQSAAVVGYNNGLVENCRNYADVVGYSCWIGGIVGHTTKTSVIKDCYNAGNVTTGYAQAGGIVGQTSGYVYNCVNTGDISAIQLATNYSNQLQRAGGIVGGMSGAYVENCVNYGTVRAQLKNAGGISGSIEGTTAAGVGLDVVLKSIDLGNVYCGDKATLGAVGGLGFAPNADTCYYDIQAIGLPGSGNSEVAGIHGVTTAELTSGTALEGFSTDLWDFTKDMYPTLKQFAAEPKVEAARRLLLSMPAEYTVANFLTEATLTGAKSASLANGSIFKVEGSKVIGPKSVEVLVSDTLYLVNNADVVRPILLTARPAVPLEGKGTADVPYLIKTAADWSALANYMSSVGDNLLDNYIAIDADIDCDGADVPRLCADNVTRFEATLDGRGHTVSNFALKGYANTASALIGTLGENGSVKNLTLKGSVNSAYTFASPLVDKLYGSLENITSEVDVTTNKQSASGIAGNVYGGATLTGITIKGTVTSTYTSTPNLGGIAATVTVTANDEPVKFKDCTFAGKIVYDYANITKATVMNVGGFAGTLGTSTFENCVSKGEIEIANDEFTTTVGGFAGTAAGLKDNGRYEFTNCVNETPISAAGKIAGFVAAATTTAANAQYIFTDCANKADIYATAPKAISSAPTAGIITTYTPGSRFIRCSNEGALLNSMNVYTGGIVGSNTGTPGAAATPDSVLFVDCYNIGDIVADGNQGGGIAGFISGAVILTNCYNTGNIEGKQMLGGITSAFSGNGPRMINCYNTGNVTAREQRAGGLIAWGSPTATNNLVEGCWNSGNISSTSELGAATATSATAVGGLAGNSGANFKNCYSVGSVKGLSRVGGLVGETVKNATSFENCYFAGTLEAPVDSCGSIIGVTPVDNGRVWTADNKVVNTFYLATDKSELDCKLEAAKAVSLRELCALDLGEGFVSIDNYTEPVVKASAENQTALFHAAQLIVNEADEATPGKITKEFNVGGGSAVVWTANIPAIVFDGDKAKFTEAYNGAFTVTKSAGDLSAVYELSGAFQSGVDDITADDIVSETYFNAAGIEVAKPAVADGSVYIVVLKHSDGSTTVVKKVSK